MNKIKITFKEITKIKVDFSKTTNEKIHFNFENKIILGNFGEIYDGDYVVIPQIQEQSLTTKDKFLKDNVKIKKIPYYEITNISNGKTVYIG